MLVGKVERTLYPDGWDAQLASIPYASAFQSTSWAALVEQIRGSKPLYLTVEESKEVVLRCLLLKEGMHSDRLRRSFLRPLVPFVNRYLAHLSWTHGPLFHGAGRTDLVERFIGLVDEMASCERAWKISFSGHPVVTPDSLSNLFVQAGYQATRRATYLVDIDDGFPGRMQRSVRKNVQICEKKGVEVSMVPPEEFIEYYGMVAAFRRSAGLPGYSYRDFREHVRLWGERRRLFAARFRGRIVAGLGVLVCNGLLLEVEAASSPVCRREGVPANDLLKYRILEWGLGQGFDLFDLAGVAVCPASGKEEGIKAFKGKFGGRYVEYNAFERTARRTGEHTWSRAWPVGGCRP